MHIPPSFLFQLLPINIRYPYCLADYPEYLALTSLDVLLLQHPAYQNRIDIDGSRLSSGINYHVFSLVLGRLKLPTLQESEAH